MGKKKAAFKRADPEQPPASAHDAALSDCDERGACPGSEASSQGAERVRALDEKLSVQAGELTIVAEDAEDSEEGKKSRLDDGRRGGSGGDEGGARGCHEDGGSSRSKEKEEGEKSAAANAEDTLAIRSEVRRRAPRRCSFHDEPDSLFVETSFACFSCPFVSRRHIRSAHSVLAIAMTGDQGHPILYRP
jgi:hypothetical protein